VNVIETSGLEKRYRNTWALRDCTLAVPAGHVVALVGPNGAGKTTLLHCAVGLITPTSGDITVLGDRAPGSLDALERIAFVAQDAPLHQYLSVRAMLVVAHNLNRHFDTALAERRLDELEIPTDRKVGKLSGGEQAQLALALALARHPDLLVLDEPLARLDPLARHDFMALVLSAVVEHGLSVLFSSHVVSELERVADYLVLLAHGQLQMAGEIEGLLAQHAVFSGPSDDVGRLQDQLPVVHAQVSGRRAQILVRTTDLTESPSGWERDDVGLEELVLAYLREPAAANLPGPIAAAARHVSDVTR
jgi:ABC-2 type transport system ATP-binding protein